MLETLLFYLFLPLWIFFQIFYVWSLLKKDMSVIDIAWGLGFSIILLMGLIWRSQSGLEVNILHISLGLMVCLWSLRLSFYLLRRNLKKGQEDFRYQKFRSEWGNSAAIKSYFNIFLLQMGLMLVVALPIILLVFNSFFITPSPVVLTLALIVWLFGFLYESIADYQMESFKKASKKGEVMDKGLWRYSRHPNYFGEMVLWWGIGITSFHLIGVHIGLFALALIGPAFITFLLVRVSGVPMLEVKYKDNQDYQNYIRQTNSIIPGVLK